MSGIFARGTTAVKRTAGVKQFTDRDGKNVWSDNGEMEKQLAAFEKQLTKAVTAFKKSMDSYAGNQALEAVAEYVAEGEFSIVMLNGEPHVAFRVYDTEDDHMMAYASLEELLTAAKEEAEEEKDEDLQAALRRVASYLMPQEIPADVPAPEVVQPKRRGRTRARTMQ